MNHHDHSVAYWLAHGISLKYACFVKTIPNATTRMQKFFRTAQEAKRKDIERTWHWEWKNCPSAWKGMFQGKSGVPTVVLEAIADHTTRFWHFNFGSPGALNDINVLDRSPLF